MKSVGQCLGGRTIARNLDTGRQVKAWVDNHEEWDIQHASQVEPRIAGKHGRDEHLLDLYVYTYPSKYPHIEATYSWSRCKKCNQTRWVKKEAWFNGDKAICYDRYVRREE
jgi:hypothetical protein